MAADNSDHEKTLKELARAIEKENADLSKLREKTANATRKLEDLRRRELEEARIIEEEKKFEKEKKNLLAAVEQEKVEDFKDFYKDMQDKIKAIVKDDDWEKIEEITNIKDEEIAKSQEDLDKLEEKHAEDSEELGKANEAIWDKKRDLDKAREEIKKLPGEIRDLKQKLIRYRKFIEVDGKKEYRFKKAFYLNEMEKTIQRIEEIKKSSDQIVKRLDRKGLEDAQTQHDKAKKELDKSFEKCRVQRSLLEKERNAREEYILKEIEEKFPK